MTKVLDWSDDTYNEKGGGGATLVSLAIETHRNN